MFEVEKKKHGSGTVKGLDSMSEEEARRWWLFDGVWRGGVGVEMMAADGCDGCFVAGCVGFLRWR